MKNIIISLLAILLLCSACNKETEQEKQMADIKVAFSGFDIILMPDEGPQTRADKNAKAAGVKRIALKIYDINGVLIKDTIQNKDVNATGFGEPINLRIPVGSYKFVAVAHSVKQTTDLVANINSTTEVNFGAGLVNNPTYTTVQDVIVSGNTTQAIQIDFGTRKNATFTIHITDATPADVTTLEMIINPTGNIYTDLLVDPSTGFALVSWQYKRTVSLSSLNVSTFTNFNIGHPLFLTAQSETIDVKINALNNNNDILYTRTLKAVPLQRGHRTYATGTFFSSNITNTFTFDTTEVNDTISLD